MMRKAKTALAALLVCALAAAGIGFSAGGPQAARAAETQLGNVVDMREEDYVEVPVQRANAEQTFADSELKKVLWSCNEDVNFTGTKPFFDGNRSMTIKLLLPYNVQFATMQIMLDSGGQISFSKDGTTWPSVEDWTEGDPMSVTKANPEWCELDITKYLAHDETAEEDFVYVKIHDTTPADGSGPIVRVLNFVCPQTYDFSDSTKLPALSEDETIASFLVAPGHENTTEADYLLTENGQPLEGGGFRFFDGDRGYYAGNVDAHPTGYLWSKYAVYKFQYGALATGIKLDVEVAAQFRIDVAVELDETVEAGPNADELTSLDTWTTVAVGSFAAGGGHHANLDLTKFMEDNAGRTIYVKISDPTAWNGGGPNLYGMSFVEVRKAAAPVAAVKTASSELFVGGTLDLSTLFTVTTADAAPTLAYLVDGTAVSSKDFRPATAGVFKIKLEVTDANGSKTTSEEATVTVRAVTLSGVSVKTKPTKTQYTVGEDLDLAGAKLEATFSDGSKQEIAVTAAMVTGFDKSKEGEQTLTVTYEGKTTTFKVTVAAEKNEKSGCGSVSTLGTWGGLTLLLAGTILVFAAMKKSKAK